jgi:hypothetical protein
MKRYTLSVYDNIVKEPVMTVQVDEFSCTHGEDGASVRAGKDAAKPRTIFMNTTFNIEQKFDRDFNPGRVLTAVSEGIPYPSEIQALRNLLLHLGWVKIDVRNNPGEEFWRSPKSRFGIRIMDPAWFDAVNLPPFLKSVFQCLSEFS